MRTKIFRLFASLIVLSILVAPVSAGAPMVAQPSVSPASQLPAPTAGATGISDSAIITTDDGPEEDKAVKTSHRLIVELESPPLVVWAKDTGLYRPETGRLDVNSADAQSYIAKLEAEQAAFMNQMQAALPGAFVSNYMNEFGVNVALTYQIVFNGVTVDPGEANTAVARKTLAMLPGVRAVHLDYAHQPDMYASLPLINASAAWNNSAIGGMANAGAGIKVASMDGGIHKDAPMFDGTGFSYPAGYPKNGLGLTANNNGKIIASRAYFRTWDPPAPGDENPWPGTNGTPHGNHTSSTAAGNQVVADYLGITTTISGVAPAAWVMSYRVFYNSITNDGSFYNAEGIAALEDILMDGADVLNNSWGGGPGSVGGEFDPLDQALTNLASAGTFISMSAGNAGPGNGTSDHPSDEYIGVAATTSGGTYASGRLNISAPEPISPTLQALSFSTASFGGSLPAGEVITYSYRTAAFVDSANFEGCNAFAAGAFTGYAAVISRGACEFGVKVLNAEQAGAEFVVIYNHTAGGDELINMGGGVVGHLVTIPSIFVGRTNGLGIVDWYATNGDASVLEMNMLAFQIGNTPDFVANFSSRGPGVGNVLKPDIAAPGVNIMAQGYTPNASGEARHMGYGQASGTSMAAPHVTGAAALIRQIHPDWSNATIKSALMTTSKYIGIWNGDNSHAQPLDMGAGRLDLTNAADPGVILDPPSLSFGSMVTGTTKAISVAVTSVATQTETYALSTVLLGGTYPTATITTTLPGFTVSPISITLPAGGTATFTVTFNSAQSAGTGDNQGFIVLDGSTYDAHTPAWARVTPPPAGADVLVIDNDASSSLAFPNYVSYYTDALDALGLTYDVWNADANYNNPTTIPDAATLSAYKTVIYYTGDNYYPDGSFTVATPLTGIDQNRLTEYANGGGVIIAMGQDMSSVLDPSLNSFFDNYILGDDQLQDSVTGGYLPPLPIVPMSSAPSDFQGISLDLGGPGARTVYLSGANEVPPVATTTWGNASFAYNNVTQGLSYNVNIYATITNPITVTASHIHAGTVGVNGGPIFTLLPSLTITQPVYVTDTLSFGGSVVLTDTEETLLLSGGLYINVHTTTNPSGEVRGQVVTAVNGDGAANQYWIDEMVTVPWSEPDANWWEALGYTPLLKYPGWNNIADGVVAMAHRDQPTLERSGTSYSGRSVYTSFGLEGVNNGLGFTSREALLGTFLDWAMDEPTVIISDVTPVNASNLTMFEATLTSNITGTTSASYRWDFGDGSGYAGPYTSNIAGHVYDQCGTYTVRVESVDSLGNRAIGSMDVDVTKCVPDVIYVIYLPLINK